MRGLKLAAIVAALMATAPAPGAQTEASPQIVWPGLTRFESESAFKKYLRAVQAESAKEGYALRRGEVRLAQGEADAEPECDPLTCPMDDANDQQIVVTGSRASSSSSSSVTNVQKLGVDEGDIVKQYGRFFIVLQDARLFVVDTAPAGGGLKLADRADVYSNKNDDAWYDEILIHNDLIAVTGYSYDENASQITVFRISRSGKLRREGKFYISSDDYYDGTNYATRLVDDSLVIYSPLDLSFVDLDMPFEWPLVRRWTRDDEDGAVITRGRRMFDARRIYKPVQKALEPVIHTVSVCPLGAGAGKDLECRTSAVVGPTRSEMYVSKTDAFLWVYPGWWELWGNRSQDDMCPEGRDGAAFASATEAALFRLPLSGAKAGFLRVRGAPSDQFALETSNKEFRALLGWVSTCWDEEKPSPLKYFHAPLADFSASGPMQTEERFVALPSTVTHDYENRFTEKYLVYGDRLGWGSYPPDEEDLKRRTNPNVVVVPVDRPADAITLNTTHEVIRMERAGDNMVFTGYVDDSGLSVSLVDLKAAPRIASTAFLAKRYETEGRSHAFNSLVDESGAGVMGLPTALDEGDAGRWWWRSESSDVSFLSVTVEGALSSLGALRTKEEEAQEDYECEVSCIDWYGNSRALFVDGRIYALTGVELIEGAIKGGSIEEIRRLNLTGPVGR